ncbi:hypothetical protein AGMMS49938_13690 [Fibrobacterales bacterium]|nr:hypothetical protein AGMMS49938_13690 [Fibrobacterales bacterium]
MPARKTPTSAPKQLIRFDWAIKRILRNKADYGILEGFLSELFKDDIKIKEILESEGNQEFPENKFNRVDILVKNKKNELLLIEIQNDSEADYWYRMQFGVYKTITDRIKLGKKYKTMPKVYSINIVYFDIGHGEDYVYRGKTEFKGLHKDDLLELSDRQKKFLGKENVSETFPEYFLLKINAFDNKTKDRLDEWIYYLKNDEVLSSFRAKGLAEVRKKLQLDNMPPEERKKYEYRIDRNVFDESIIETARMEGEFAGEARKAQEIAHAMKLEGIPVAVISKTTGLSKTEIDSI